MKKKYNSPVCRVLIVDTKCLLTTVSYFDDEVADQSLEVLTNEDFGWDDEEDSSWGW